MPIFTRRCSKSPPSDRSKEASSSELVLEVKSPPSVQPPSATAGEWTVTTQSIITRRCRRTNPRRPESRSGTIDGERKSFSFAKFPFLSPRRPSRRSRELERRRRRNQSRQTSEASCRVPTAAFQPSSRGVPTSSSLQQRRPASSVQPPSRLIPTSPTPSSSFVSFQRHLIWSSSVVLAGWVFVSGGSSTTTTTSSWVFNISPFSNLTFAIRPSFGFHLRKIGLFLGSNVIHKLGIVGPGVRFFKLGIPESTQLARYKARYLIVPAKQDINSGNYLEYKTKQVPDTDQFYDNSSRCLI
ncbi:hypothetical protein Q3G72_016006 [Acer saccharum]|nr:hypothetical protein Q3G72_016006 [Acer saccharum]